MQAVEDFMQARRMATFGILALVVAIAAAAAMWWFTIRDDAELADSAPEIPEDLRSSTAASDSTIAPSGSTVPAAAGAGVTAFTIIPERSEAAYFADEELANLGVPSTAKGATNAIEGVIYLAESGLDDANASVFTVDLTGLQSDEGRRDSRVQDALETSQYPTATFTATRLEGPVADLNPDSDTSLALIGILDLHGIQEEVTWDVLARRDGDVITATATVNFLYEQFDVPILNIGGFVSVEDDVTLQVQLVASAAS